MGRQLFCSVQCFGDPGLQEKKWLLRLVLVATLFSVGHTVDHIIRGNHVGWPLIVEVTPFTYSFGFYPVIALGVLLYLRERVGTLFWAMLAGAGFLFVGLLHFGPLAAEPPSDIITPYRFVFVGYLALAWLVLFLGALLVTAAYAGWCWWRRRDQLFKHRMPPTEQGAGNDAREHGYFMQSRYDSCWESRALTSQRAFQRGRSAACSYSTEAESSCSNRCMGVLPTPRSK